MTMPGTTAWPQAGRRGPHSLGDDCKGDLAPVGNSCETSSIRSCQTRPAAILSASRIQLDAVDSCSLNGRDRSGARALHQEPAPRSGVGRQTALVSFHDDRSQASAVSSPRTAHAA